MSNFLLPVNAQATQTREIMLVRTGYKIKLAVNSEYHK